MQIRFHKYQGTGNDFIILDNRDKRYDEITEEQVAFLCDRRYGIGADGLMMLNLLNGYDFEMIYHNSDGKPSSMCGNGGRCLTKFASDIGIAQTTYQFKAIDGEHESTLNLDGTVSLKMGDVDEVKYDHGNYIVDTGSPHFVTMATNLMHLDVNKKGAEIRYNSDFKTNGINVNFVELTDEPDRIIVRTYERGVEAETLSCGTGVTAAALVCCHNDNGFNRVEVQTRGGRLSVEYDKLGNSYRNIWLAGPALRVFEGTLEI